MISQFVRRTLISFSLKHQPTNLTISSSTTPLFFLISSSFSSLVTPSANPSSEITNLLITHHKFSPETALKISTHLKDCKKSALVLDYFKQNGFSDTQLEELVLCDPRILAVDLNKRIRSKVRRIKKLGFSDDELSSLLCKVPGVLTLNRSVDSIASSIYVLQRVLCSNSDVVKLLSICNWFLSSDLGKNLVPNVALMENCGVSKSQIRQTMFSFPRFFLLKTENMRECMRRVDEMGLARNSKLYIHGVRVVSSMTLENWESKLKLFRSIGFTEDDIVATFRRTPQVFAISERKILEVSKLLLSAEGMNMSYLINHSELLIYSPQLRIKPRLEILNVLSSKCLLLKEPTMTFVCKMTNEEFIKRYVLPYQGDIGEVGARFFAKTGFEASS